MFMCLLTDPIIAHLHDAGIRDNQMPYHGLETFGVGVMVSELCVGTMTQASATWRYNHRRVQLHLKSWPSLFGIFQGIYQIGTDIFFLAAARRPRIPTRNQLLSGVNL